VDRKNRTGQEGGRWSSGPGSGPRGTWKSTRSTTQSKERAVPGVLLGEGKEEDFFAMKR